MFSAVHPATDIAKIGRRAGPDAKEAQRLMSIAEYHARKLTQATDLQQAMQIQSEFLKSVIRRRKVPPPALAPTLTPS